MITTVTVNFGTFDSTKTCCPDCQGQVPKTLHITNNHGSFTLTYVPLSGSVPGHWSKTYTITFSCAKAIPDPISGGSCQVADDDSATVGLAITVQVFCPNALGAPWRIQYQAPAETTYFRFVGATLSSQNCGGFTEVVVSSPRTESEAPGCATTQTFPAPATPWVDTGGHSYATVPDPGITAMTA